jgi:hypothetical protein
MNQPLTQGSPAGRPRPFTNPANEPRARVVAPETQPGGVGAECGVFKGEFAFALLERWSPSEFHPIDPSCLMARAWHRRECDRNTSPAGRARPRTFEDDLVALAQRPDHQLDRAYRDSTPAFGRTETRHGPLRRKVNPNGITVGDEWRPDPSNRQRSGCKPASETVARGELKTVLADQPTLPWAVPLPG